MQNFRLSTQVAAIGGTSRHVTIPDRKLLAVLDWTVANCNEWHNKQVVEQVLE